ncbi:SET domain-containing protein [Lactarius quietus]|nr:SET domain-containing protein [Lactarius quietus]
MSTTTPISPPDEALKPAIQSLRTQHPTLGVAKLHALLLSENAQWTVSEKRLRRMMTAEGLTLQPQPQRKAAAEPGAHIYPSSALVEGLDVAKWTVAVEIKYFDKKRGKGLIAKEPISEGQIVWKEDPFIIAPEWDIYDLQIASRACGYCTTPLTDSSLVLRCPASTSSAPCPARFCHRLCLKRSEKTHPLLSSPLLAFARKNVWMAFHALTQCAARLLLAQQAGDDALRDDWRVYRALAELGMEERAQGGWLQGAEPDRELWQAGHRAFVQAFVLPPDPASQKKLAKLTSQTRCFTYEGFLHGLGRMSLNIEAHGGLYTLHSHLNHNCRPNVSVRHVDQRTSLSRIAIVAKRDIALGVRRRRIQLGAWGFGECMCERCIEEEKEVGESDRDVDDLERELKAGLGVM